MFDSRPRVIETYRFSRVVEAGHHDVGGVDGDALGPVGRDGVAKVEVLPHVLSREDGTATGVEASYDDGAVPADVGDAPAVTVLDPPTRLRLQGAVIAAGDDEIPDRCPDTAGQVGLPPVVGAIEKESLGTGSLVQRPAPRGRTR